MLSYQLKRAAYKSAIHNFKLAGFNAKRTFNAFRPSLAMRKSYSDNFVNGTSAVYVDK